MAHHIGKITHKRALGVLEPALHITPSPPVFPLLYLIRNLILYLDNRVIINNIRIYASNSS